MTDCGCTGGREALDERIAIKQHDAGMAPTRAEREAEHEYRGLCPGCAQPMED